MRVTVDNECSKGKKYPYVGKYISEKGEVMVVLFTKDQTGTCLHDEYYKGSLNRVGEHKTSWAEDSYTPTCITLDSTK